MNKKKENAIEKKPRLNSARLERLLLVLICCLAVLLSVLILVPGLRARAARQAEQEVLAAAEAERVQEEERQQTLPQPQLAVEQDWGALRVRALREDGQSMTLPGLVLELRCPDGTWYELGLREGETSLSGLPEGEYSLRLLPGEDSRESETVRLRLDGYPAQQEQPEALLLGDNGEPVYRYRAALGPNGCLLSPTGHCETDVLPLDLDGDGSPDCGLRIIRDEATGTVILSDRVPLTHGDGTPLEDYALVAEPVQALSSGGWLRTDEGMVYLTFWGERLTGLQKIDGKYYLFDPEGLRVRSLGIDVSYFNEDIDWEKVKAQGIDFAIVRVGGRGWSSGAPYDDIRAVPYLLGAQKAGLHTGVYFYTTAVNEREAVEEAKITLKKLRGMHLDMPVFIDMEDSGEYPFGRSDRLTAAERTAVIRAFCQTVKAAGYEAGVYTGQYYYQLSLNYPAIAQYTIWMANYTYGVDLPTFPRRYDIWQFSDWGSLAGLHGHSDMNAIF